MPNHSLLSWLSLVFTIQFTPLNTMHSRAWATLRTETMSHYSQCLVCKSKQTNKKATVFIMLYKGLTYLLSPHLHYHSDLTSYSLPFGLLYCSLIGLLFLLYTGHLPPTKAFVLVVPSVLHVLPTNFYMAQCLQVLLTGYFHSKTNPGHPIWS